MPDVSRNRPPGRFTAGARTMGKALLGLGLLALLIIAAARSVGPTALLIPTDSTSALAALLFNTIFLLLGGVNIRILLERAGAPPLASVMTAYLKSWCVGLVLPARAGELTIVYYLGNRGVNPATAFAVYIADKIITFLFYALLPLLFLFATPLRPIAGITAAILLGILTIVLAGGLGAERIPRVGDAVTAIRILARERPAALVRNGVVTVARIALMGLAFFYAFRAFGHEVAWAPVTGVAILSSLIAFIPISLGGLGTVEATALFLFGMLGVTAPAVLAAYVLLRLINYGTAVVIWLIHAVKSNILT